MKWIYCTCWADDDDKKWIFSYIINYIIQEWNENYIIIIIELYQAEKSKQEKWEIYIIKINTQNCTFIRLY